MSTTAKNNSKNGNPVSKDNSNNKCAKNKISKKSVSKSSDKTIIELTKWGDTNLDVFLIKSSSNNTKIFLFPEELFVILNNYEKLKNIMELHNFIF